MLLPSVEETQINLTFSDGQEPLSIDAMDIDNVVKDVWSKPIPEDATFEDVFVKLFKQRYQRTLSKTAANMLVGKKNKVLNTVKKKLSLLDEPSDSSEQAAN